MIVHADQAAQATDAPGVSPRTAVADVVRGFNPYLHGARGLFAFMILLFHIVNSRLPTFALLTQGPMLFLLRTLEYGVELFFAVSGIVIVGALSRARGPLIFAIERATRIYPVLWVTVIIVAGIAGMEHVQGRELPSPWVLTENMLGFPPLLPGPLIHPAAWSLSYELCFYGFCALAWTLRRRLGIWAFLLVVPAAAYLLGVHLRAVLMPVGMAVAALLARRPGLSRYAFAPGLGLLAFLVAWGAFCGRYHDDIIDRNVLDLGFGVSSLLVIAAVVSATFAFTGILGGRGVFSRVLRTAPFQFLGGISYSLYLWHPILLAACKHFMYATHIPEKVGSSSQLIFLALTLPPSLAVGWASQQLLEKRVTVWLRRRLEAAIPRHPLARAPETTTRAALEPSS